VGRRRLPSEDAFREHAQSLELDDKET